MADTTKQATPLIYQKISDIIASCPAIGKNDYNPQQKFKFRGIDAVMNVFQPLLAMHRVFVVPEVIDAIREERQTKSGGNLIYTVLTVKYTFYAEDGSSVTAVVQGEGMDSGDKGSNKAMSIAFKYALFQVFCIPTEEMRDPDAESYDPSERVYPCADCGQPIKSFRQGNRTWTAAELSEYTAGKYGRPLCTNCAKRTTSLTEALKKEE